MTKILFIFLAVAATLSAQKSRPQRVVNFTAGGTANAITGTPSPALAAYSDLSTNPLTQVCFTATATSSAAVTVNLNGLGAKALKKVSGGSISDAGANDVVNGQVACAVYLSGPDYLMLTTPAGNLGSGGGGSAVYSISKGCWKWPDGTRGCSFNSANGSIGASVVGSTNASEIVGMLGTATTGEKVGIQFRMPITPTTWTASISVRSTSTDPIDVTFNKVCVANGATLTSGVSADGSAVTVTPSASGQLHNLTKTLTVGSCAAGDYVSIVVSSNTAIAFNVINMTTTIQ